MHIVEADEVDRALDYESLVEALREGFREGAEAPVRHHHAIDSDAGPAGTLLLMPAWQRDRVIGVKVMTVFPGNAERGLATVLGSYLLNDGRTGEPLALVDGPTLTARRTAGASALAADYLARKDAARLAVIGTGTLAPQLIRAHASVRPIRDVRVWGRTPEKAERLAESFRGEALEVTATRGLEAAVREADVISCATMASEPLVLGAWLRPGQHLDLVGAFKPEMRESDDEAVRRAAVFVDTFDGALQEGGDVVQPLRDGVIGRSDVLADLFDLTHGRYPGRESDQQITLFKSVGTALEDLAAARLAYERAAC